MRVNDEVKSTFWTQSLMYRSTPKSRGRSRPRSWTSFIRLCMKSRCNCMKPVCSKKVAENAQITVECIYLHCKTLRVLFKRLCISSKRVKTYYQYECNLCTVRLICRFQSVLRMAQCPPCPLQTEASIFQTSRVR